MSRTLSHTGASTLQLGTVTAYHLEHRGEHFGESDLHLVEHEVGITITMQEWIAALCGDHHPEFQRQEVTKFGEIWTHWKCHACNVGERIRGEAA